MYKVLMELKNTRKKEEQEVGQHRKQEAVVNDDNNCFIKNINIIFHPNFNEEYLLAYLCGIEI